MSVVCSVIIPSYRAAATIRRCIDGLRAQIDAPPFEIIVVDSSPDDTAAIIGRDLPDVWLIHLLQQTDPARARNIGAGQAQGHYLLFVDADCVADPQWVRRMVDVLDAGYDAVGGAIRNANGDTAASWAGYFCEFREFLPCGNPRDVENLTLGNAGYKRDPFWAVGGFPAGMFPQEDQVFHAGLRQTGARIRFDPQIVVAHHHRAGRIAFLRHQRLIGRANARVLDRLRMPGHALVARPWLALAALPALAQLRFARTIAACWNAENGLLRRQPAVAVLCWLGMWWWGVGLIEGTLAAKRDRRSRPIAVAELELSAPLPTLSLPVEMEGVLALVRRNGQPVGLVRVDGMTNVTSQHWQNAIAEQIELRADRPSVPPASAPISIVVCTHERPDDLARCLHALLPLHAAGHEVIVVDNAPRTGRTGEVAARFPFRYLVEQRQGLDHARNCGLRAAQHPIVAYTDDDAVADGRWADAIAAPFADPSVGCVTGLVLPLELETPAQQTFEVYCAHRRVFGQQIFAPAHVPPATAGIAGLGANMALRRELALRIGGFDPRLDGGTRTQSGGDTDMFARVLDAGQRIVYTPDALVWHRHRREAHELDQCLWGYGVGLSSFLAKRVTEQRDPYAAVVWARWLLGPFVRAAIRRKRDQAAVPLRLLLLEAAGMMIGPLRFWQETRARSKRINEQPKQRIREEIAHDRPRS